MAIYDKSQLTIKQSDCDAKSSIVDKATCYNLLIDQYNEIIKSNADALNADSNTSGSYAILKKFTDQRNACGQFDPGCVLRAQQNMDTTNAEINIRQGRLIDARAAVEILKSKIKTIQDDPTYSTQVSAKKRNNLILWGVVLIIIIGGSIWAYKKYKS